MESFLISTGVVAIAEIGDKTQLLALLLAARFRKPVPIVLGILAATLANHAVAALIGMAIGGWMLLFAGLALACYRLVTRSSDHFVRIATAGIMTWLIVQALINIGAVIGLLPVIGVPLPLVSSGGSSLITSMFALGILLSFARTEPGCAEALSARPSALRRSLAVIPGVSRTRRARS